MRGSGGPKSNEFELILRRMNGEGQFTDAQIRVLSAAFNHAVYVNVQAAILPIITAIWGNPPRGLPRELLSWVEGEL